MIPGFADLQIIHEGRSTRVLRGRRSADGRPVVLKTLRDDYPSSEARARLRLEYEVLRSIEEPGVVKAIALEAVGNNLTLVLEDVGAAALHQRADFGRMAAAEFLELAVQMATVLGRVHRRGIIHKDVTPANFIVGETLADVQLIDFDLAARADGELIRPGALGALEGTLAYMAPEQTGRMNRKLDWRADLYGLGATWHEALTGQPPFSGEDALALVHHHLATSPPSVRERRPDLPEPLAEIIQKLLAKSAEDRYLGAYGLIQDLERCRRELAAAGTVAPFALGQRDVSDRFNVPGHLYGRERELRRLVESFERASRGRSELMLVSGEPGIGKSVLVNEVQRPMVARRGYVVSGKFDQLQRSQPYSALAQAFGDLLRRILGEPEPVIAAARHEILAALDGMGRLVTDIVPELELLIGPQPALPELGAREARNRFNLVLQNFVLALPRPERPLVVFIDDLQWADLSSLDLLGQVLEDARSSHLLIIGAYRDNEVHSGHPLMRLLERCREAGTIVDEIKLHALDPFSLNELVADATLAPAALARGLSDLVLEKTGGNPFFVRQFLRHLVDQGRLRFDEGRGGWQWDLEQLRREEVTDNVVAFVIQQVLRLEPATLEVLQLAACLGGRFDLSALGLAAERGPESVARDLLAAIDAGLVLPSGSAWRRFLSPGVEAEGLEATGISFHFAHDRVQQAAYNTIAPERRPDIHLRIGRGLRAAKAEGDRFAVVAHLNLALERIVDADERAELIDLNRAAGRQGMASAAYEAAHAFFGTAVGLLPAEAWEETPALALSAHQDLTDAASASQRYDEALRLGRLVIERAPDAVTATPAYLRLVEVLVAQHRNPEAVSLGLDGLAALGLDLPRDAGPAETGALLQATAEALGQRSVESLIDLPLMTDPSRLAAMALARLIAVPSAFVAGSSFVVITCTMVQETLAHGVCGASAFGLILYSNILCGPMGQQQLGYRFGRVAIDLLERLDAPQLYPEVIVSFETSVRHWVDHQARSLEPLLEGYRRALSQGNFVFAALCAFNHCTHLRQVGRPLDQTLSTYAEIHGAAERLKQVGHQFSLRIEQAAVTALVGQADGALRLVGATFDEDRDGPALQAAQDVTHLVQMDMAKATLALTMGRFDLARDHASAALGAIFNTGWRSTMYLPLMHFCGALGVLNAPPPGEEIGAALLERCLTGLASAAETGPMNYAHKLALVRAEEHRLGGRVPEAMRAYDEAIEGARTQGYLQEEALAAELAGRFYSALGHPLIAETYTRAAYRAYQAWGAKAKLDDLLRRHPFLRTAAAGDGSPRSTRFASLKDETFRTAGQSLDLATVTKAMQAISGEIELDRLLGSLLTVAVENAGADVGAFIDLRGGLPRVAAVLAADRSMRVEGNMGLDACDDLAHSVVRYALRSGRTVLVGDAQAAGQFEGDPHLRRGGVRSVLCLPILQHGAMVGLLYLENREVAAAFTPDRLELLGLLAGQAAISLENARLYQERSALVKAYARFVPAAFLSQLGKGSITEVSLGDGTQVSMTVLFCDLRGFTARAENSDVTHIFGLLNRYLGRMVPVIERAGGVVDKYMGDAVMALFPEPGSADTALQAALGMLGQLAELNRELQGRSEQPLAMGIGLHTGRVILGTIGAEGRMDGTAIGDTVNLASRVEGVTKRYGIALAISGATHKALEFPSNYLLRPIDRVKVVGRSRPVDVYEVYEADPPERIARKRENQARIAEAVAAFQDGDLDRCVEQCRLASLLDPEDEVAALYLQRCRLIQEHGLPPDGEMAAVLTEK